MSSVPPQARTPRQDGRAASSAQSSIFRAGAAGQHISEDSQRAVLGRRRIDSFRGLPACWCFLAPLTDPRKNGAPQRWLFRNCVRLAGARLEVRRSPGFDPTRTCFLFSNHVNLFDPFVLYSAIPQFFRGLELESHFRVPVYRWLMKRFGNVPVPDDNRPSDLKRMWRAYSRRAR